MNLVEALTAGASQGAERAALVAGERTISYVRLGELAGSIAGHLGRLGVRAGDRVALLVPTVPEYVVAYYGILGAGAVVVPINSRARAPEIRYMLEDSGVGAAIAHGAAVAEVRQATAGSGAFRHLVAVGAPATGDALAFDALLDDRRPLDPRVAAADDLAQVSYTSGTTGHPKGVMLTHANLALNAEAIGEAVGLGPADRQLAVAPLSHILGCTLGMLATLRFGATAVFCAALDPDTLMGTIERERCTLLAAVATLYLQMVQHERTYDLGSLRLALSGGAPTPPELLAAFPRRFGVPLVEGYGMTEIGGAVTQPPLGGEARVGAVGLPVRHVELAILDDADRPLPDGQVGEICARGPTVMRGYWGQPDATAETLRGGWLHTGDLGYRDADGYCYIVDRKKDVIITSGFNVYPREVEDVLYQHPAVAEAGVVGLPHPVKGEQVRACIALRPGATATAAELIAFCKERLTPYKAPVAVDFFPTLPRGPSGKTLRRELRALLDA